MCVFGRRSTASAWRPGGGAVSPSTATPIVGNSSDEVLVQLGLGNCTAAFCGQEDTLVVLVGGGATATANASNSTDGDVGDDALSGLLLLAVTSVTLGVMILATVVGTWITYFEWTFRKQDDPILVFETNAGGRTHKSTL